MTALLLLLWVTAAGACLERRLDPRSTRIVETLALGAAIGAALLAAFGFVLGWAFGLTPAIVGASALLTAGVGVAFGQPETLLKAIRSVKRPHAGVAFLIALSILGVTRLADQTLTESAEGGIATGDRHNFGDLPFHMGVAAGFAYGDNFPPAHPELAGVPLTYPFFCDLLSAMILVVGGSWRHAFFWPTVFLGLSLLVALTRFGEALTGSRALARVATALTVLGGGLGFLSIVSADRFSTWWSTGADLTIREGGARYANFVTTLFIPQRAILFGWPLLFFALALIVEGLEKDLPKQTRVRTFLHAGLVASLLPLVHSHSFAVLGLCVLIIGLRAGRESLFAFALGVLPLALPAVFFMLTHNSLSTNRFFEWRPGFDGGSAGIVRFWLMNAGVFLPLAAIGVWRAGSNERRLLALPFAVLFILANLFRLSPWIWDNMKFLAPAHAGLAAFAAIALGSAWRLGRVGRIAAVTLFLIASLSGGLDVARVLSGMNSYTIFTKDDLEFAARVRATTDSSVTILSAPIHNHSALLSGRRVFLGYEGHLWSQGLDYAARKPVAEEVFRGQPQTAVDKARSVRIDVITLTPLERSLVPDPKVFEGLPSIVESPYRLLKVR